MMYGYRVIAYIIAIIWIIIGTKMFVIPEVRKAKSILDKIVRVLIWIFINAVILLIIYDYFFHLLN